MNRSIINRLDILTVSRKGFNKIYGGYDTTKEEEKKIRRNTGKRVCILVLKSNEID